MKKIFLMFISILILTGCTEFNKAIIEINNEEAFQIIHSDKDILLLDVRTPEEYYESHIENSAFIPHTELEEIIDLAKSSEYSKILIYCRTRNKSDIVAQALLENGINNIYIMYEGYLEWDY